MTALRLLARTARTASVLIAPCGARFALPRPMGWELRAGSGDVVSSGTAMQAGLFLDQLQPQTQYALQCEGHTLCFVTPDCAGLVQAAQYGVHPENPDNTEALAQAVAAVPSAAP